MPKDNSKATRSRRQADAAARQNKRDARSTEDQLALIADRPGKSARETARLSK